MPNHTIVLKGDQYRWHDEGRAYDGSIKPGYLIERKSDGTLQAHSIRGGKSTRFFAKEDYLQGGTVDGVYQNAATYYSTGDLVLYHKAQPDDVIQAVLKVGESVLPGDWAISYGDGRVCKAASASLANITAASTTVTNTVTETTFSNGTITLAANSLKVGDVIRVRGQAVASATNSTDTLTVKGYIGSTQIFTTGAVDVANGDIATFDFSLVVRSIGATGTVVAFGTQSLGVPGTVTSKPFTLASTTVDTTGALTITIKATWSVANAGNVVALQSFIAEKVNSTTAASGFAPAGGDLIGQFLDTLDLSAAGADDFVKLEIH